MHLLDRLIRAVLIFCMMILCGYILIRTVTIAGENGMFQDSPVWSAIYRKLELYSLEGGYKRTHSEARSDRWGNQDGDAGTFLSGTA